jgi:hypothetical protein
MRMTRWKAIVKFTTSPPAFASELAARSLRRYGTGAGFVITISFASSFAIAFSHCTSAVA